MKKQNLVPGVYEQVVNRHFAEALAALSAGTLVPDREALDDSSSAIVLADYLTAVLRHGLGCCRDGQRRVITDKAERLSAQCRLVNRVVELVRDETEDTELAGYLLSGKAPEQLLALLPACADPGAESRALRPLTPLARATLFTGDQSEAPLDGELRREIRSCDRVDLCVSFIKMSGLRLLMPALRELVGRRAGAGEAEPVRVRVLCSTYTGATDQKAVEQLCGLGTGVEVRVSYEEEETRMHAKAYIFHRSSRFSTAYVGSSNISGPAITRGLEWNLKIAEHEQPDLFAKVAAAFESSWQSGNFERFDMSQSGRLREALERARGGAAGAGPTLFRFGFDISPRPYQRGMLDAIAADREIRGLDRSLLVAATGTGKTVVAALDFRRFLEAHRRAGKPARLLFVAHRKEILEQAMYCFRGVLRDENFGELMVGTERPRGDGSLFMSIQSFGSRNWKGRVAADWYQYIVIDETHHAPARSYRTLLDYFQPEFWLGLTATPERMDNSDVTAFFNGRFSYELRMPEAVEQGHLCPFQYFCVTDSVDYSGMAWRCGHYDVDELEKVYVMDTAAAMRRAGIIVDALDRYLADPGRVRCVGFCVSVTHARFMADRFTEAGLGALALTGKDDDRARADAIERFRKGEVRYLFVVDIFNEGIDIPSIDTILFLRPTESLTVFLQQLGRGLRRSAGKECLTVLDFVGRANRSYRLGDKLESLLLAGHRRNIGDCVREQFADVPRGCSIQLERVARDFILDNLNAASSSAVEARLREYSERVNGNVTLTDFLADQRMEPAELYRYGRSFARICVRAGVRPDFSEPDEKLISAALSRLCAINSRRWLKFLLDLLPQLGTIKPPAGGDDSSAQAMRMLQMFYFTFWQNLPDGREADPLEAVCAGLRGLARDPLLLAELGELFAYSLNNIRFLDSRVDLGFPCPLDAHCSYTRNQILAAMDMFRPDSMRQGVFYVRDRKIDIFLVTLEKSDKYFSATTNYADYAMGDRLFHWQSQSTTSDTSPTARRYIGHRATGNRILLFVRDRKKGRFGETSPFIFLGLARYAGHEGSLPVSFTWELELPMPPAFIPVANKMTA